MMDFQKEIEKMRAAYERAPMQNIALPRPVWLNSSDALYCVYREKKELLKRGKIVYAYVVQANEILFRLIPQWDCPANLIYSEDPSVDDDPIFLQTLAEKLFSYKNTPPQDIPEEWQDIVRVITDEYDRSSFSFEAPNYAGKKMKTHFLAAMIYRKLLPRRVLRGGILPVLVLPEICDSVLVLPKKYWSEEFKRAWINREI